jgi:hypothetical protein
MAGRYIRPSYQYFDNSNRILDSGKLYFYESGTTTLKDVYSDPDGLTAIANPVILNGAGRTPDIYLDGSYKLIITDKNDAQIEERDPVLAADDTTKGFSIWNAISIYEIDDIIRASNNLLYISISDSNQNNEPSATATKWTAVQLLGSYNANQIYFIGNVVIDSIGDIYRSRTDSNVGNTPASSPTDWTTVVAGAFSGNVTVGGTLGVTGATTLSSTLGVTGVTSLANQLNVNVNTAGAIPSDAFGGSIGFNYSSGGGEVDLFNSYRSSSVGGFHLYQIDSGGAADLLLSLSKAGALGITGVTTVGADILSDTNATDSLGSTAVRWLKGWFSSLTAGNLTIGSGSITDSSGAISFGDENLATTGTLGASTGTFSSNITLDNYLYFDGGTSTHVQGTASAINIVVAGSTKLSFSSSTGTTLSLPTSAGVAGTLWNNGGVVSVA